MNVCYLFLSFFIYSVIGYFIEVISCSIRFHKITMNRGFFLGPYLPIFGLSSLVMCFLLKRYSNDYFVLFVMSSFICTIIEFVTSYVLEKIFHARWWDYHDHKFHIDGRVCINNSLLFGLGGIFVVKIMNPFVMGILRKIPRTILYVLTLCLFLLFLSDVILTLTVMCELKIASVKLNKKDNTEEINTIIREKLSKNSRLMQRMLNAFPKIKLNNEKNSLQKIKLFLKKK